MTREDRMAGRIAQIEHAGGAAARRAAAQRLIAEAIVGAPADAVIGGLAARSRALAGLRVGARRENVFVWRSYVAVAQHVGLTRSEIMRVAVGPTVFAGHDAAVLWMVDHVLARRTIDPATQRTLGEAGVLSVRAAVRFDEAVAGAIPRLDHDLGEAPAGLGTPGEARGAYIEQTG